MSYSDVDFVRIQLDETTRGDFVVRVYQHLLGALVAFAGARSHPAQHLRRRHLQLRAWQRLLVAAHSRRLHGGPVDRHQRCRRPAQPQRQYAALFGSAGLYAILFAPMLHYFFRVADDGATSVAAAGLITAVAFAGLTVVAVSPARILVPSTDRDVRLRRRAALIVGAIVFGLSLGVWFSVGMVALTGAAILCRPRQSSRSSRLRPTSPAPWRSSAR